MDIKQIEEYKNKLERERLLLLNEIKQNEKPVDLGRDPDHPEEEEEADETEEVGNQLAVVYDLNNRLEQINVALGKIRSGKYGICEQCGKAIEPGILDIDPESRFCKHCKSGK